MYSNINVRIRGVKVIAFTREDATLIWPRNVISTIEYVGFG